MATNEVLQITDEVLDGEPRYNITNNGDGTNSIELANDVVQEGTQLNRALLRSVNNVLSYLTPSVEKVPTTSEVTITQNILPTSITQSWSGSNVALNSNKISGDLTTFNGITPTYSYETNTTSGFKTTTASSNYASIQSRVSGTNRDGSSYFLTADSSISGTSSFNSFEIYKGGTDKYIRKIYDMKVPSKITLNYRMTVSIPLFEIHQIEGSNDNTNWDILSDITNSSDQTFISNDYYRYYRINVSNNTNTMSNAQFLIYYCYISSITAQMTTYKNQFTLDNNGNAFTNNQRVLVETPLVPTPTPIIKYQDVNLSVNNVSTYYQDTDYQNEIIQLPNGKTATFSFKMYNWKNNGSTETSISKNNFNRILGLKTTSDTDFYQLAVNNYLQIIFETLSTFKLDFGTGGGGTINIDVSYDGTTWENIHTSSTTISKIIQVNNIKGIRLTNNDYYSAIRYFYLKDFEYLYQPPVPTDYGVTSNTLNGIDIPTILQPSTKYELIYKEDTNKFEFRNLGEKQPLFDITLTQEVNQVDLTGIANMLEVGKIYAVILLGNANTTVANIQFGDSTNMYSPVGKNTAMVSLFTTWVYGTPAQKVISGVFSKNGSAVSSGSVIEGYEYIKYENNSYKFNAGTRIIIKEVA